MNTFYKKIGYTLVFLIGLLAFGNSVFACDNSHTITIDPPSDNGNGTFDISLEVCIGDAGSEDGISLDVSGGAATNIIGFSPATLTDNLIAVGSLSGGNLTYFALTGSAPGNMFVEAGDNTCFNITITVAGDPSNETIDFSGVNADYPGGCAVIGSNDVSDVVPALPPPAPACGGTYTDPGGAGNYGVHDLVTDVICPDVPGEMVTISFSSFNVENGWDYLYVYDGNTAGVNQIAALSGNTIPGDITSTQPNGCLTLLFDSDGSVQLAGFELTIDCPTVLPIDIKSFDVVCLGETTKIQWETGAETMNSVFYVEKTFDGMSWNEVGKVSSQDNLQGTNYQFIDNNSGKTAYYRIRQVDENGVGALSEVKIFTPCTVDAFEVELYPNPNKGSFTLNGNNSINSVQILNMDGRVVKSISNSMSNSNIQIDTDLPSGVYFVNVKSGMLQQNLRLVIQ